MNPIKILSKLLQRSPSNEVVSTLYTAMAQPLFVHPHLGQMVMRSYLEAVNLELKPQVAQAAREDDIGAYSMRSDNVAVINISGALVAHEMNVPCQQSPTAYSLIKQDMQALLDDPTIDTIIGRFDSPGGVASQNVDLSDFIYGSRGQGTRLIAQVDDMAYSAAYAIASAFDEIRVTRTSGVGSVGVVSYHVDQSEANAKAGIKVEYIYAGDKKVLGNPNEPLTEEGRAEYKGEVLRLYEIFTAVTARNMGMTIEAVKATQAGTFHGQEAIDAGFAHTLGTFDELIAGLAQAKAESTSASISMEVGAGDAITRNKDGSRSVDITFEPEQEEIGAGTEHITQEAQATEDENTPESEVAEPAVEQTEESDAKVEEPAQDAESGDTDGVDDADGIIDDETDQATQDAATALASQHENIKGLCVAAGVPEAAEHFIKADMTVETVREQLLDLTTSPESSIVSATSVALKRDRSTIQAGWKQAFDKVAKAR